MLDFLYGLGEVLSLLALASGFILTICCRHWADEAHTRPRITDVNLFASPGASEELPASLARPGATRRQFDKLAV